MNKLTRALGFGLSLTLLPVSQVAHAQSAPSCQVTSPGFQAIASRIPLIVGSCTDNERPMTFTDGRASGTIQHTVYGAFIWVPGAAPVWESDVTHEEYVLAGWDQEDRLGQDWATAWSQTSQTQMEFGLLHIWLAGSRIHALCSDGNVSYSVYRAGTCAAHGGVYAWMY